MTRYIKKPKPLPTPDFTIVYDDREKRAWTFLESRYGTMKKHRLKCGDYTIKELESLIAIEKKSGIGELLSDLTGDYRQTFKRFLKRLSSFPVKCMIVESELSMRSIDSAIYSLKRKSNGRSKLTKDTVYYWIAEITLIYGIPVLFMDKRTVHSVLPFVFESAYRRAKEIKLETK